MNPPNKNKWLVFLIVLLLIANSITIAMFWIARSRPFIPPGQSPADFMVKELKLSPAQEQKLKQLAAEHRHYADSTRKVIKNEKDSFFDLLKQQDNSDSSRLVLAGRISKSIEAFDLYTWKHFQDIRNLCNPEQQKKFDEILRDISQMIAGPRPHGPPHPGGRPDHRDGPPPRP